MLLPLALATWVLVHESGVHATVAGVALALTVPVRPRPGLDGREGASGLADRFEHRLRPVSAGFSRPLSQREIKVQLGRADPPRTQVLVDRGPGRVGTDQGDQSGFEPQSTPDSLGAEDVADAAHFAPGSTVEQIAGKVGRRIVHTRESLGSEGSDEHADQASRHTKTHECTEPAPHSLPTGRQHDRTG